MLNKRELEVIQRYVKGEAVEDEITWIENLFATGNNSTGLNKILSEDWKNSQSENDIPVGHILDRVHHLIRLKEIEKQKSFKNRFIQTYSRVAAVILIPVLLAGSWFYLQPEIPAGQIAEASGTSSIYAPLGSRVAFNLPDGTTGFLNSGSTLTYSIPFAKNRSVTLKGEAWFDVVQDEQNPFEIGAGTSAVKVLGTSFNVSAYEDESYMEVVLAEGKLEFSLNSSTPPVLIEPSDRLVFNGEKIIIEKTDPAKYKGWTEGKLIFRGDNMSEVAHRLERWYNIEVEVADSRLNDYVFRATFEDDSLEEVLRLLSMTSPLEYRVSNRQVQADGTWKKAKVTLYNTQK